MSRAGSLSLVVASLGFLGGELALSHGLIHGRIADLAIAGFEAATIGGVADWFAVSALFRHLPIPFIGRHTDIIVRNRARITEQIATAVEREWLAPAIVARTLSRLINARSLLTWLADADRRQQAEGAARQLLGIAVRSLPGEELAPLLSRMLGDQLKGINLGQALGGWLEEALARGQLGALWAGAASAGAEELSTPAAHATVRELAREAARSIIPAALARQGTGAPSTALAAALGRLVGSFDIARPVGSWLEESLARGTHLPLETALLDRLRAAWLGSPEATRVLRSLVEQALVRWRNRGWRQRLLGGGAAWVGALDATTVAEDVAQAIDATLQAAIGDPSHPLRRRITSGLGDLARALAAGDPAVAEPLARCVQSLLAHADLHALAVRLIGWLEHELVADASLLDWDAIGTALVITLREALATVAAHPDHPLRRRGDAQLLAFARRLHAGEPGSSALLAQVQERFLAHLDLPRLLAHSLDRLQGSLGEQLADPASPLARLAHRLLERGLADLAGDAHRRERLDQWLTQAVLELSTEHHAVIGAMVRASLDPRTVDDRALVASIEARVGDDLQRIRLNGALVGGAVGVALAALKLVLH
jgi:uncharacterized membrane-anchored protein YjiN (DUF445 family)